MNIQPKERRDNTKSMVNKLIVARQEMLVMFCRVAGIRPYSEIERPTLSVIQDFCGTLIDYISLGHFEVFRRVLEKHERRNNVEKLAAEIYADIVNSAIVAVDFNDKYELKSNVENITELDKDLSHLGKILALRLEHEDKIIQALTLNIPQMHQA